MHVSTPGVTRVAFFFQDPSTKLYFPQKNGTLFFFGRDVNINWRWGDRGVGARVDREPATRVLFYMWLKMRQKKARRARKKGTGKNKETRVTSPATKSIHPYPPHPFFQPPKPPANRHGVNALSAEEQVSPRLVSLALLCL